MLQTFKSRMNVVKTLIKVVMFFFVFQENLLFRGLSFDLFLGKFTIIHQSKNHKNVIKFRFRKLVLINRFPSGKKLDRSKLFI